jgi:hypothetical protein
MFSVANFFLLSCYSNIGGELVLTVDFPGEQLEMVSFRENRALLLNNSTK